MKPQPKQHSSRQPRASSSQASWEDIEGDDPNANESTLISGHLTLHHVLEGSIMLRNIAQVLTPRAMTQPMPSRTTAPLLGRLTR